MKTHLQLEGATETKKKKIQQLTYFLPNVIAHLGSDEEAYEREE